MGWYVTCDICGISEKYGLGCNCYEEEKEQNLARMKGCTVEDSYLNTEDIFEYLCHKLRPIDGTKPIFYLQICISDGAGEYRCWRKVVEITKEKFEEGRPKQKLEN